MKIKLLMAFGVGLFATHMTVGFIFMDLNPANYSETARVVEAMLGVSLGGFFVAFASGMFK